MRLVVVNLVSLDGVLQAPGRADEDTQDGFIHGGWAEHENDPAMGAAISARLGEGFSWLFGRRSYEGMLSQWNATGGPFKDALNNTPTYVASSKADTELVWPNFTLLFGDVPAGVARLRDRPGGNLVIMGSGQLIRSLLPLGLVDELFLMIHPLVIGSGRRLFGPDHDIRHFELVELARTDTGVLLATYRSGDAAT